MDFSPKGSSGVIITSTNRLMFEKYLSEIARYKPLDRDEEKRLLRLIRDNNDPIAIEKICKHNLLFVVTVARRYSTSIGHSKSLALEDLVNEGNIGLIEAIRRFDPEKDNKFISYAVWWIKQHILVSIQDNIKSIRIPSNAKKMSDSIQNIKDELEQTHGFEAALSDVFHEMKERGLIKQCNTYDKLSHCYKMSKFETSLNVTAGFEDGEEIIEFITDDTDKNAETLFYSKEIKSVINNALASLSERQRNFIVLHFGLNGNEKMQLSDIAIKFDTSVAIVSKDIQRAIKILKIRHGEILRDFV